jgi:hypothetical protein
MKLAFLAAILFVTLAWLMFLVWGIFHLVEAMHPV